MSKKKDTSELSKYSPEYQEKVAWLDNKLAWYAAASVLYPNETPYDGYRMVYKRASLVKRGEWFRYGVAFTNAEFKLLEKAKEVFEIEKQKQAELEKRRNDKKRDITKHDAEYAQKVKWLEDAAARTFVESYLYPNERKSVAKSRVWNKASMEKKGKHFKYKWEFTNAEFVKLEEAKKLYLEKEKQRLENL